MAILVVEDYEDLMALNKLALSRFGQKIIEAADGKAAYEAFRENITHDPNAFSLVVTDWEYPDGGGRELINKIRKDGYRGPILIATGNLNVLDEVKHLGGIIQTILKPYGINELRARTSQLLEQPASGAPVMPQRAASAALKL